MIGYDIVGDIHGQAKELAALLSKIGYQQDNNGLFSHATRKVIFLGDFIDRGSQQKRTIEIVRPMIESGNALSVIGNHEFNAIAYYLKSNETGEYLRKHSEKNWDQHKEFLAEFEDDAQLYKSTIEWFMTLPFWLEIDGFRVVHACWDSVWIKRIKEELDGKPFLNEALMVKASNKDCWEFDAIERLLKGKEIPLKPGISFNDNDGVPRQHIRVRWWDKSATTFKAAYIGPENAITQIPDDETGGDHLIDYSHKELPVFLGHYWMTGEPEPLADNIACVDYSVANKKGKLVAYQWDGEQTLSSDKFVWVDRAD